MESPSHNAGEPKTAYNGAADRISDNGQDASPWDALRQGLAAFAEVREYIGYLVTAKLDGVKASVRSLLLYTVAGLLGLVVALAIVGTSAVLLLIGIAHGVGELFHHAWIGEIIVPVAILLLIAVGLFLGLKWAPAMMRKQLVSKYESRQRKQRSEYGHDVADKARAYRERTTRSGS